MAWKLVTGHLEEDAEMVHPLARMLIFSAYNLYSLTICGNPSPQNQAVGRYMRREPMMGQLVMEISTIGMRDRDVNRLGRLLSTTREEVVHRGDDPAQQAAWRDEFLQGGEPVPTEKVWYIVTPDGRLFRWWNADFICVPEELCWRWGEAGVPAGQ